MIYDVLYLLRVLCVCHESVTLHIIVSMSFCFNCLCTSEVGTDETVHINQFILYYCFHILISKIYNSNDLC